MAASTPVLGFAAFSGTGKTTLLKSLIPLLKSKGLSVAVVKHAHHDFDIDIPGKDSYELRHAGAQQVIISSSKRYVKIHELEVEKSLEDCLTDVDLSVCDLVLVEGFKRSQIKKIELHRPSLGFPLLFESDVGIVALATDSAKPIKTNLPLLDINQVDQIADFIINHFDLFSQLPG